MIYIYIPGINLSGEQNLYREVLASGNSVLNRGIYIRRLLSHLSSQPLIIVFLVITGYQRSSHERLELRCWDQRHVGTPYLGSGS